MGVIHVDSRDRKPIYEQLTDNITQLVLRGVLAPDEQLPGIRTLAGELAINPNTIQKAYSELERRGIIYSVQGRGSFVSDNISAISRLQREKIYEELTRMIASAKDAGSSREELISIIDKVWREHS